VKSKLYQKTITNTRKRINGMASWMNAIGMRAAEFSRAVHRFIKAQQNRAGGE